MVCENSVVNLLTFDVNVLILVLVEDGLREVCIFGKEHSYLVLILVLVEDGLRESPSDASITSPTLS